MQTHEESRPESGPSARRSRADRTGSNRAAIMRAAAKVVGEVGYAKASVSRIMEEARLGQGTFYSYFNSRQELFDILLPELGVEMLAFVRGCIKGSHTLLEVEARAFQAFADYVLANPGYGRILFEAPTMAPAAARTSAHQVNLQHVNRLTRAWNNGELPGYTVEQIPQLSSILLSLRRHFACTCMDNGRATAELFAQVAVEMIRRTLIAPTFAAPSTGSVA
jgi:AcrR family transcriptional regulator